MTVMSIFEKMLFAAWIVSNMVVAGMLVWQRVIVPRKASRKMLVHHGSARTLDDFKGVVWG
jgi:hypothetical protein